MLAINHQNLGKVHFPLANLTKAKRAVPKAALAQNERTEGNAMAG